MKRRFVLLGMLIIMLALVGCTKVDYTTVVKCVGPNWTSDGKVEYFKVERVWKHSKNMISEWDEIESEKSWLCEENADGTGKVEKGLVFDDVHQFLNESSSSGEWVVFDNVTSIDEVHNSYSGGEIWIIKRDGSGLEKVGEGLYPDLSPDGSKIVYAKPNQGIWIMNRGGSGDHQILEEGTQPVWSPDGSKLIYRAQELLIADNNGNIIDSIGATRWGADWGPLNSDSIIVCDYSIDKGIIIDLSSGIEDTLSFYSGTGFKWSNDGEYILGSDSAGYYSINLKGTNKHYIEP